MNKEERVIPGYDWYSVTNDGIIKSIQRDLILKQYELSGYCIVDTFRGSLTETLPVHRAVALAWVENLDPNNFNIVNHKDGNPKNNYYKNLEWTDYSGNNYHAVNNGLRIDNIQCKIRDFYTKEIKYFNSLAQASSFMGFTNPCGINELQPKMFGKLIKDRYEFKFINDHTPWFYENRTELVSPSRYLVSVTDSSGHVEEIYSNREFIRRYQLYDSTSKSIPSLAEHANKKFKDKDFVVRDGYTEERYRETRNTESSEREPIHAFNGYEELLFVSLTACAKHFNVDRSTIASRIGNGKRLNGWYFVFHMPFFNIDIKEDSL